jgi:hypothetical protein
MDALSAIVSLVVTVALVFGALRLTRHWQIVEVQRRQAEAWGYLKWEIVELEELHNKFVDLIAAGHRKPAYFRSIEAIKDALEMKRNFAAGPKATRYMPSEP